jgi:hypothetical protein
MTRVNLKALCVAAVNSRLGTLNSESVNQIPRMAKTKARIEIRRADKIELKNAIWFAVSPLFLISWESRKSIDIPENPEK